MDGKRAARDAAPVPTYYFSLFNDVVTLADEGLTFDDDAGALAHAVAEARALAADTVLHGHLVGSHYIEVRGEERDVVGKVRFDEAVEIR